MGPLIAALGSGAANIIGGLFAKREHNKFADKIAETDMSMPGSMSGAEAILAEMADQGLPGVENLIGDVRSDAASTMSQAKSVVDNPQDLLDALIDVETKSNQSIRGLGVQDAQMEAQNKNILSNFLGQVKAPAEFRLQDFENQKMLAEARERMMGNSALMEGIMSGIGGGISTYGNMKSMQGVNDLYKSMEGFWDTNHVAGDSATGQINNLKSIPISNPIAFEPPKKINSGFKFSPIIGGSKTKYINNLNSDPTRYINFGNSEYGGINFFR